MPRRTHPRSSSGARTVPPSAPEARPEPRPEHAGTGLLQREFLDGLFVLAGIFTPEGTLLQTNERTISAFGLSREEVLGTSFTHLVGLISMARLCRRASSNPDSCAASGEASASIR